MTARKKVINYFMQNPCLSDEVDYQPDEVRLQVYTDWVNNMGEEELKNIYSEVVAQGDVKKPKTKSSKGASVYLTRKEMGLLTEAILMLEEDYECSHPEQEALDKVFKKLSNKMYWSNK